MTPFSLKTKMTVTISLVIAGLLSILALSTQVYFVSQIKQLLYSQQFSMVTAIADQIDDKLRSSQIELTATASTLNGDAINDHRLLSRFFAQKPDTLAMFDNGLFLFSASGNLIAGNPVEPTLLGTSFLHRDYIQKTLKTRKPQISEPFQSAQPHRHPIVMLTAPVINKKGEIAAVLAGSIDLTKNNFLTKLGKVTLGKQGYLHLYNKDRVMIVHPDPTRVFKQDVPPGANVLYDRAIAGFEGTGETVTSRKVHVISSFKRIDATGWILASNFPQDEAYAPIYDVQNYILAALVLVFLLSVVVVWVTMKFLTAPLLSLTEQIRTLTADPSGGANAVCADSEDEIGVLCDAFNQLMRELESQRNELKRQLDFSRILIDITPIPVYYKDPQGRYLGCNQAFLDFNGLAREDVLGKSVFDLLPRHLADMFHQSDLQLAQNGGVQVVEAKVLRADLTQRDVIFFKTNLPENDGSCAGLLGTMLDITERNQAEAALKTQKEFAESLVLNSTAPTFVLDTQHRVIIWNYALEALTGIKAADALGTDQPWKIFYGVKRPLLADLILDDALHLLPEYYTQYRRSTLINGGIQAEGWYEGPDGIGHYITISAAPILDAQGRMVAVLQVMEDITERKRAQDALEKTRHQLQLILDAAGEGINGVDREGRITFVNQAAQQMLGWTQEELLGQNQHLLMHHSRPDGSPFPECDCPMARACAEGRPYHGSDELFWRKDGTSFYAEYSCNPIREEGELVGAVVMFRDMTERRQAEEQLLKLSQAVMQSPVSIVITDTAGNIEFVNPRFCQENGYEAEEVLGQNPRILKSGKTSPDLYQSLWDSISSGKVWTGELYNRRKDGSTHWEHVTISPIRNANGDICHYMSFMESISDRKKLEEQLRQSQKMEAIGQLAGGVAHDFNNILTVVMGFGQLLQHSLPPEDSMHECMDQILDAADRATHLTRSLLAFSRKQVMHMQQVELNELAKKHTKFLVRIIGEDVTLKTSFSAELLPVMADSGQLEQVLMNLATNARDAMPGGGELTIKTESVQLDKEFHREHGYGMPGRYALITVTDTGTGMDTETQQKIFEPFFTTKLPGRGTGLGLSIVYGIIKQHGGYITLFSQRGFGTTFSIYLPLLAEKPVSAQKGLTSFPEGGTETILVVEDDPPVGRLVESVLKRYGYKVILAASGEEALELYQSRWSEIDLALLDVIMPKMNGKELCEKLRERTPQLKVLFLSGYTADLIEDKGILIKGVDIMKKPAKPIDLARKVRDLLDSA